MRCGASPCFGEEFVVNKMVLVILFGFVRGKVRWEENKKKHYDESPETDVGVIIFARRPRCCICALFSVSDGFANTSHAEHTTGTGVTMARSGLQIRCAYNLIRHAAWISDRKQRTLPDPFTYCT